MGTISFILGKTYFALASCIPTLLSLTFTDEVIEFLNQVAASTLAFFDIAPILLICIFSASLLLSFSLHKCFLKKYLFSLAATFHIPVQFAIIGVFIFLIIPFRQEIMLNENWPSYLLFGFLLSVVISDVSYYIDYCRRCPIHLIPIESVLSKKPKTEDEKESSFFRLQGFLWVDFEKGIVSERDEVKKVLAELSRNGNALLIVGNQASGKSIILRELGYRLANRRFKVFFVNAESLQVDRALEEIRKWDMSNVTILVDDVHRNPIVCSDFLARLGAHSVKVVLSSRPLNVGVFREGKEVQIARLIERKIEAKVSRKLVSEIIFNYCRSLKFHFVPTERDIDAVIEKCGTDLWLLTYLLSSWDPRRTKIEEIRRTDIYRKVYETRVAKWMMRGPESLDVIQIICALYQYEIPCEESYLVENGLNTVALNLSLEGHLIKKGRYYYLHHPSVARIYLETLESNGLIKNLSSLSLETLSSYLNKNEEEMPHIFYRLSTFPMSGETKEMSRSMLEAVELEDLANQINREENIDRISSFLRFASTVDSNLAKTLLKMLDEEILTKKMLRDPILRSRMHLVSVISSVDESLAERLFAVKPVIAAFIPLYNEERFVYPIIEEVYNQVDVSVVIDDGSTDSTKPKAEKRCSYVIQHRFHEGLYRSIITALNEAIKIEADVTILDFFPWIVASEIPKLITPILNHKADLVVAKPFSCLALSKRGVEKFGKYLPKILARFPPNADYWKELSQVSILLSRILKTDEVDVEYIFPKRLPIGRYALLKERSNREKKYHN